jgi:hypothetical protein
VGEKKLNTRYCFPKDAVGMRYIFDVREKSVSVDLTVWICGKADSYYLIPVHVLRAIKEDPLAWTNSRDTGVVPVVVDLSHHVVTYKPFQNPGDGTA